MIDNHDYLSRPAVLVMLLIVAATLIFGMLFLSAAEPVTTPDGAIEWHEESVLRAVVKLLCLNYRFPTVFAGDLKYYVLSIGTGLALLTLGVSLYSGTCDSRDFSSSPRGTETAFEVDTDLDPAAAKTHIAPVVAAQVLVGLFLLWSFASSRWSSAPAMALGGSAVAAIPFLWSLAIGNGLSAATAQAAARLFVAVSTVTAGIAVWYHFGRNPTLRADFPVGNPTFLAACLMPAILLALAAVAEQVFFLMRDEPVRVWVVVENVVAVLICSWAFYLAGSRGAYVGLLFGLLALGFLTVPRRGRIVVVILAIMVTCAGAWYATRAAGAFSPTGRDLTLRLRMYAWSYAWEMFTERPYLGQGQSAFARLGDARVVNNVLHDPMVFDSRLAHAHNEWLEVLADLGAVGMVLIGGAILLTLHAGLGRVSGVLERRPWVLIGLLASLAAYLVEESFGVGLRTSAVPISFFTVLGLTWALSNDQQAKFVSRLSQSKARRLLGGTVVLTAGTVAGAVGHHEFSSVRRAFDAQQQFDEGNYEDAIRLWEAATQQLHPDRALMAMFRLAEAHLAMAESLEHRAADRLRRAGAEDASNPRLAALAGDDLALVDGHCEQGSGALKELLERSPGYLNQGVLEYGIDLTRARTAAARGDTSKQTALRSMAASAIRRELTRQPYDPQIALNYLYVAAASLPFEEVMETIARPLRHHAVNEDYLEFLRQLHADPGFRERWPMLVELARRSVANARWRQNPPAEPDPWAPERLRLAAALFYLQTDYAAARDCLEIAVGAYDELAESAPVGAATGYAELAICRFFSNPADPSAAIAAGNRAIQLAPVSRIGRELVRGVQSRMVTYLLASGDESAAFHLLEESAPSRVTQEILQRELGARYRGLAEALLRPSAIHDGLQEPTTGMESRIDRWLERALTLNSDDARAWYVMAELSLHAGREADALTQLRTALQKGVAAEHVGRLVASALKSRPNSKLLSEFANDLGKGGLPDQSVTSPDPRKRDSAQPGQQPSP